MRRFRYLFSQEGQDVARLRAGITAAAGICADLGVPLTHRGIATSVRFLTGHAREGGEEALDDATDAAVDPQTTLVVYMGLATLPDLTRRLTAGGALPLGSSSLSGVVPT